MNNKPPDRNFASPTILVSRVSQDLKLKIHFVLGDESSNYRPQYLDHFDKPASAKTKKELSNLAVKQNNLEETKAKLESSEANNAANNDAQDKAQEVLNKRLLEQISGGQVQEDSSRPQNTTSADRGKNNTVPSMGGADLSQGKFQRCIAEGDLDFVSVFSNDVATRLVL